MVVMQERELRQDCGRAGQVTKATEFAISSPAIIMVFPRTDEKGNVCRVIHITNVNLYAHLGGSRQGDVDILAGEWRLNCL